MRAAPAAIIRAARVCPGFDRRFEGFAGGGKGFVREPCGVFGDKNPEFSVFRAVFVQVNVKTFFFDFGADLFFANGAQGSGRSFWHRCR